MRLRMARSPRFNLAISMLTGLLLAVPATSAQIGSADGRLPVPPAARWSSVGELLEDWHAYQRTLTELSREERVAIGLAFFEPLAWSTVLDWCREGHPAAASEEEREALLGIVSSKLRGRGPGVDTLLALLADSGIVSFCQEPVVKYISKNRALFAGKSDGERLARAFLALADSRARTRGVQFQLERGAVCLWDGDELMTRMMAHCRSGDELRMGQGVALLGIALDARATDSLMTFTRSLVETGAHPRVLEKTLVAAGRRGRGRAFEIIRDVFEGTPQAPVRRAALLGLGWTGDQRAHAILLREYADSTTGIVDSTQALSEERGRYWDLWLTTRIAEPSLIEALREGRLEEALLALELIDRQSRYGPPASEEIYETLETWAAGASAAERDRVDQIIRRFRAYPDYRTQPREVGGF